MPRPADDIHRQHERLRLGLETSVSGEVRRMATEGFGVSGEVRRMATEGLRARETAVLLGGTMDPPGN